jgi:hypothetical protein
MDIFSKCPCFIREIGGRCRVPLGWGEGVEEGPERGELFIFQEEVAGEGIVFDHLFDDVLCFGDAVELAQAVDDDPIPVDA